MMKLNAKKKLYLLSIIILLCPVIATTDGWKYYADQKNGYSGIASATFWSGSPSVKEVIGMYQRAYFKTGIGGTPLEKMSMQEKFLITSALHEYDIKEGEEYIVTVQTHGSNLRLCVGVVINRNRSFSWYNGFYFQTFQ